MPQFCCTNVPGTTINILDSIDSGINCVAKPITWEGLADKSHLASLSLSAYHLHGLFIKVWFSLLQNPDISKIQVGLKMKWQQKVQMTFSPTQCE